MNAICAVSEFPVAPMRVTHAGHETGSTFLSEPGPQDILCEGIVGRSAALRAVLADLEMVAPTDATVLICGETGTGKELIASAVRNLSRRLGQPFVKCNCAAIPTGLLESELFGHEKGAFTGAVASRVGRFELANHGTIFLDEIGELPLELQPKLLRVLQEREFERVGSSRAIKTDARLVAATNVNLPDMVEAREFRADLYYRLNVFPIILPALRERRDDIPLLVRFFARHYAATIGRRVTWIAPATMDALVDYSWPGNIRELQNLIERAVIRSSGDRLEVPLAQLASTAAPARAGSQGTLEETERAHILATLK